MGLNKMTPPSIHILPEHLLKRIAAGEVVERPSSVVKELIENSVDGGAESIQLIVEESGLKVIQVIDDGQGMSEEDLLLCTENHATSKISRVEDLEGIHTLGFRGEALASIGSVSRMSIISRTDDMQEGTKINIEAGQIEDVQKVAAQKGTSVSVKDLFGNVPARRKFMKTPATELRNIITVFRRMALCYPNIHFVLYIENDKTLDLQKETFEDRIKTLFGEQKLTQLTPVKSQNPNFSITGYVSRPGEFLKSRSDQYYFLNHRQCTSHKNRGPIF